VAPEVDVNGIPGERGVMGRLRSAFRADGLDEPAKARIKHEVERMSGMTGVEQDKRTGSRRRRIALRAGAAAAVAVAALAVLSIVNVFGPQGPSIVEKATAALAHLDSAILHVHTRGIQDNGDGTVSTWEDESWQSTAAPFARRQIESVEGGPATEVSRADGGFQQLYDASANTIYQLLDPSSETTETGSGFTDEFREAVLEMLQSGEAKVDGHEVVDGRDAVRIVGVGRAGGSATYLIDAATNDPIEWRTTGDGGGTVLRFVTYQELPATPENLALLSVTGGHPDATLDTDPAHYQEALARMFPKG